jgi:N-methylhydantoinase B
MNTPVESLEMAYPMRVLRYSLREGSGGKGQHNGGDGIVREYEFLSDATVTINSERRTRAPHGLQGGDSGTKGVNTIQRANGSQETVSAKYTTQVSEGDKVKIETPGGGGYGKQGKRRN